MLSVVVVDTLWEDEFNISGILKEAYARRDLPIKRLSIVRELTPLLQVSDESILSRCNVFIAALSRVIPEYIEFAQGLRRQKDNVFIVFVMDRKADFSACVRPSVRPSGILFIPLEQARVYQAVKEIYSEHLRLAEKEAQPAFVIKSGGDYFTIDTADILFFEAQGKKIAVKTKGQEILFYSNFESVLEQLPDWFVRCHKGFVVNIRYIIKANFSDAVLTLGDQSVIPISRTYRDDVRSLLESKVV